MNFSKSTSNAHSLSGENTNSIGCTDLELKTPLGFRQRKYGCAGVNESSIIEYVTLKLLLLYIQKACKV